MSTSERLKRVLIGRAIRTEQAEERFSRGRGVAALASDAISSNVYATQEILIVLAIGGFGLYRYGWWVAAAVVVVFGVVVAAYRHLVRQYPQGGADYQAAATNLGPSAAALTGAAMLIDFALTLAVSIAAILDTVASMVPRLTEHQVGWGIAVLLVLTVVSLRGRSGFGAVLRIGTYAFIAAVLVMAVFAAVDVLLGDVPRAASADYELVDPASALTGFALVLVLARSFSSGSIAVTGVEAIGTGVPLFRKPRGENAAAVLVLLAVVSMTLFVSITALALITGVRVVADSEALAGAAAGSVQQTVLVQIADAVFGSALGVWSVVAATVLILIAAGLSAFRSFTALSSVIARDGLLPRQFLARGDRLVYSNGIVLLAIVSGLLLWGLEASLTALIQLYVVGAFLALTLGQAGMVRHWARARSRPLTGAEAGAARRAQGLAALTTALCAAVLAVVLVSKFLAGAWIVLLLIPLLAVAMIATGRHYATVSYEMAPKVSSVAPAHQVIALILVSRIHKPTLRAIAYARAARPDVIEAVTVAVDEQDAEQLAEEWRRRDLLVPLRILRSPFREIDTPILSYVAALRKEQPDTLLTVYVPEYVVSHWWEELLHNQSAARLKRRLMELTNVAVVSVPWQMGAQPADGSAAAPAAAATGGITGLTGALPRIDPDNPPR